MGRYTNYDGNLTVPTILPVKMPQLECLEYIRPAFVGTAKLPFLISYYNSIFFPSKLWAATDHIKETLITSS